MGMDLSRGIHTYFVNHADWPCCLELATLFGWRPAGTDLDDKIRSQLADPAQSWRGWYTYNEFQRVSDADARNFAKAIYRAIAARKKPTKLSREQKIAFLSLESSSAFPELLELQKIIDAGMPGPYLVGQQKLKGIADFASEGGFAIG